MPASTSQKDLLKIQQVELRVGMKRSNIYRLIKLGQFPAPIHSGGSKWDPDEIEEYKQRLKDERDRQLGVNKFAPRPAILSDQETSSLNGSSLDCKHGASAGPSPSTLRMLAPELCQALRILKLDIPELYLDPKAWDVTLAVIMVEHSPARHPNNSSKTKNR